MNILIIDDHSLFRMGLRTLLKQRLPMPTVLEASSTEEALASSIPSLDLVLLDIQLVGLNGIESIGLLSRKWPTTPVIVLSSSSNPQDAVRALANGAAAFLSKGDTDKQVVQMVKQLLQVDVADKPSDTAMPEAKVAASALTPRQNEVLSLVYEGMSNKAIARRLHVSEFTVRGHVQAIFTLLQVTSRSQAIATARRLGWFE